LAGRVESLGKINSYRIFRSNRKGENFEYSCVDKRIILKMNFMERGEYRMLWTGFVWLRIGTGQGVVDWICAAQDRDRTGCRGLDLCGSG
jgi:hypothetical protein